MTELELYTAWKKKNIHNYEGTQVFAEAHDITPMEMSRIINKFEHQEEPAMAKKFLDADQIKTIEEGIRQGKRTKDIAEEAGCSCNCVTVRKRKMGMTVPPAISTTPTARKEEDKLTSIINMLRACQSIICADAETKSITASTDMDKSTITFSTDEAEYVLTVKKTIVAAPHTNTVTIKKKQFDIDTTTELFLERSGVFSDDLEQVARCVNLTRLDISGNPISDISALGSLTKLTELNMSDIPVQDVSALGALTSLKRLIVTPSCIGDDNFEWLKRKLPNCQIISVV